MDIQTVLRQHAEGFYDNAFDNHRKSTWAMTAYIAHSTDQEGAIVPHKIVNGACHAPINNAIDRRTALAVITMADQRLADNPGAVQFYDWLINKSFFSDVFLCKDPVLSLRYGFVKQIDVPAAKWLGAAQLARLTTSEFKEFMFSVYDVLASGFDIHPMLLLLVATELNLMSDKKTVKATRTSRLSSLYQSFHSSNSAHLPLVYVETAEALKAICKDDPTKEYPWVANDSFRQTRWPANSNTILYKKTRDYNGVNSPEITDAMLGLNRGTASMLFNVANEVVQAGYTALWQDAIDELKVMVIKDSKARDGIAINLTPLEMLSKQLKLGE
jgi:hypothetical protein